MNILIVDPDLSVAENIAFCLRNWGHRSEICSAGKKALARVRETNFDLVLLELFQPGIQVIELLSQIKQMRPDIRIITMTNFNSRELELNIRRQGILYYMIKPFEEAYLKSILTNLSAQRGGEAASEISSATIEQTKSTEARSDGVGNSLPFTLAVKNYESAF